MLWWNHGIGAFNGKFQKFSKKEHNKKNFLQMNTPIEANKRGLEWLWKENISQIQQKSHL